MFDINDDDKVAKKPNDKADYGAGGGDKGKKNFSDLLKCTDDPLFFMKNFMKARHPIKGVVPFDPYLYQIRLVNAYQKHRFNCILAGRQLGKTECTVGYILWKAMFTPGFTVLITANNFKQALEIMDRVRFSYENCPNHIRAGATEYNKSQISFDNGSRIVARATTPNAGRGLSISLLYVDEFAAVSPNIAKHFWTSIRPTLGTGGSCIITSTPQNDEDQFAQIWKGAISGTEDENGNKISEVGKNEFHGELIPWFEHPDRDEAWAETERAALGDAKFRQENLCCVHNTIIKLQSESNSLFSISIGDLYNKLKSGDKYFYQE